MDGTICRNSVAVYVCILPSYRDVLVPFTICHAVYIDLVLQAKWIMLEQGQCKAMDIHLGMLVLQCSCNAYDKYQ